MEILKESKPVYEEIEGWRTDISGATTMGELPATARSYLQKLG